MKKDSAEEMFEPICLCLISKKNHHMSFREWLHQFYIQFSTSSSRPISEYIVHILTKIPVPTPGNTVNFSLISKGQIISCSEFPENCLPHLGIPLKLLFNCLSIGNVFKLFAACLLEQKILFVSCRYSLLTSIIELITSLIFPIIWQHTYVPILPELLIEFTHSPLPFIMGVHKNYFSPAQQEELKDVMIVDIDTDTIFSPSNYEFNNVPLPQFAELSSTIIEHTRSNLFDADSSFDWSTKKVSNLESSLLRILT